jgi:putative transposase
LRAGDDEGEGSRPAVAKATGQDCSGETDAQAVQKHGFAPDVLVTYKLRSYAAANRTEIGGSAWAGLAEKRSGRESHLSVRSSPRTEDAAVKSPSSAQRLLSVHAAVQDTFNVQRHLVFRDALRALRGEAFQNWQAATAA